VSCLSVPDSLRLPSHPHELEERITYDLIFASFSDYLRDDSLVADQQLPALMRATHFSLLFS